MYSLFVLCVLFCMFTIVKQSNGFSECKDSTYPDPAIPGVNNCLQWLSYAQSQGVDVVEWCQNPVYFQKCCITCQNFVSASKSCQDIAYTPDCQQKAAAGQCDTILGSSLPISYYCSKSCGKCCTRLTCNTLFNGCNQGSCTLQYYFAQNSVQCLCPAGTGGTYCQQVDACLASPCYNGGTCITMYETDAMYTCQCPAGCYGRNCEACIGCSSIRCQNGGKCITNPNGSYYCSCPYGYTGTFCEQYVGACLTSPCLNGGTCIPNPATGGYSCVCEANFIGPTCQYPITRFLCDTGDSDVNKCQSWASLGFCNSAYTYSTVPIPLYCPISCRVCNQLCFDSSDSCPLYASMGLCGVINSKNNGLCRRSCGTCSCSK